MITRGSLLDLFVLTGRPLDYSKKLANKAYRFYLLPRKGDDISRSAEKFVRASEVLLNNITGCSRSPWKVREILVAMMMTVKSKMIEKGLKETVMNYNDFIKKLNSIAESSIGEVSPNLLMEIPPVKCYLMNIRDIQSEFDRVRRAI